MTTLGGQTTYTLIDAADKSARVDLRELARYRDLILLFVKRGFQVSYTQTVLGPFWLIIRPLATSVVYLFVFGGIAQIGTDGIPGILFYMAGTALWSFFSSTLNSNANVFVANSYLYGKVYFPRLVIPIANVISAAVRFCIEMVLFACVYLWFFAKGEVSCFVPALLAIPVLLAYLSLLGLGVGLIFSSLTVRYRDLAMLVTYGVSLLMYATPVVYPLSSISSNTLSTIVLLSPVTMPMELFRKVLFGTGTFVWWSAALSAVVTFALLALGLHMFARAEKTSMDTV